MRTRYYVVCRECGTRWTSVNQPRKCQNPECEAGWLGIAMFENKADADRVAERFTAPQDSRRREIIEQLRDKADLLEKAEPFYTEEEFRTEAAEEVELFRAAATMLERDAHPVASVTCVHGRIGDCPECG